MEKAKQVDPWLETMRVFQVQLFDPALAENSRDFFHREIQELLASFMS